MASADGNFFSSGPLNYLFLAEVLVVAITLVFFLFFWSRVVGSGIGWILRIWLWRKHKIWVEFDALQISPLSGHILFKELKYYSANMSIRAVHGHIAWRYWIWRVREEGDEVNERGEGAAAGKRRKVPTRIILKIHGLEWCLFNRTPAFDEIIARMEAQEKKERDEQGGRRTGENHEVPRGTRRRTGWKEGEDEGEESRLKKSNGSSSTTSEDSQRFHHPPKEPLPTSMFTPPTVETTSTAVNWLREALPMDVQIHTGGITLGNDATPSLLFVAFKEGMGTWEAAKTRSKLDDYKSVHNYTLQKVKIVTRTNPDYREPILDRGKEMFEKLAKETPGSTPIPTLSTFTSSLFSPLLKCYPWLSVPGKEKPPEPAEPWTGLDRYNHLSTKTSRGTGVPPTEREKQYAKVTTLVDAKELELRYYSDVAGLVPANARSMDVEAGLEDCDVGNGDLAPEWGMDLVFRGGTINYGPWADRQRDALQKAFTPAVFSHSEQTPRLKPGDPRLHTRMKVLVKFEESAKLLVPHRESSKDWEYDNEGPLGASRPWSTRRHGVLILDIGAGSTMDYSMGMVAGTDGYQSTMLIHLNKLVVLSTINGMVFVEAENCRVVCKMPSPLQWNTRRDWLFDVNLIRPTIHLLRDHVTQISDLAKDWTSGTGPDFYHFVPYQYTFKLALQDYILRLNLNDHNIITQPLDLASNVFLVLSGPRLDSTVDIPSTKFAQKSTDVTFQIEASQIKASMSLPVWSTNNSFQTKRTEDLGTFSILDVTGSYLFFSETDPDHVETLTIDVLTRGIEWKTFGWAIKHIFRIKDNYFGSFTNFSTQMEYDAKKAAGTIGDPVEAKYRAGKSDVFEIALTVTIHEGSLLFPEDLHDLRKVLVVSSPEIQVALRLHDYFMEVDFAFQPIKITTKSLLLPDAHAPAREDAIMIDGLTLLGNRLFGPQPQTAVYLCLWEIDIGRITGHTSPEMLATLSRVGKTVGFTFLDKGNSPPANIELAADPDITFLKIALGAVDFTVWSPASAFNVVLPSRLVINWNDLATDSYRSMLGVSVPQLDARILLPPSVPSHNWWEVSAVSLDLSIDMYSSPDGWMETAQAQAAFVRSQDEMTRRVASIYDPKGKLGPVSHLNGLYLPPPVLPSRSPVSEDAFYLSESEDETTASESASVRDTSTDTEDEGPRPVSFPPSRRASGSASFFTAYEDDDDITAGDESDNSTSTGSSSSATSTNTILPTSKAILQHSTFSSVLDRYRLLRPTEIFCGEGGAVKIEGTRSKQPAPPRPPAAPPSNPAPPKRPRGNFVIRRRISTTKGAAANEVLRIRSSRDIRVLFTPLSFVGIKELVVGFTQASTTPEQVIDELVAWEVHRSTQEALAAPSVPAPSQSRIFDFELTGIQVQSIQRVLTKAEVKTISESSSSVARGASISGDLHARIDWNSKSIKALLSIGDSPVVDESNQESSHDGADPSRSVGVNIDASLSVESSELRVLQATSSIAGTRDPSSDPEVLKLTTHALAGSLSSTSDSSSLRLSVGDTDLDWLDIASELIIGTVHEYRRFVDAVQRMLVEIAREERVRFKAVVWEILRSAGHNETTPLCLLPASALVQLGTTRKTAGWKFLYKLRHSVRLQAVLKEGKQPEEGGVRTDDEMLSGASRVLSEWWGEVYPNLEYYNFETFAGTSVLDYVFEARTKEDPTINAPPPPASSLLLQTVIARPAALSFNTGRLRANHRRSLAASSSDGSLTIGPYSFVARTWSEDASTSDLPRSTTRPRILHIAVRSLLGDGMTTISPALLHVIRHILRVRKVFESKMIVLELARGQIPKAPARKPTLKRLFGWDQIYIEATVAFKTASAEVDVEELGIRASGAGGEIITNVILDFARTPSKLVVPPPTNVVASIAVRIQQLTIAAEQRNEKDSRAQLLAEIAVQGANSSLYYAQGEKGTPAGTVSLVVGVEAVRTQAPASIARLYEFSESWAVKSKNHQSTLEEIIKELDPEDNPARTLKPLPKSELGRVLPAIHLNVLLKQLEFDVRVTPLLWVCWTLQNVLAFADRPEGPQDGAISFAFGLQLGLQSLRFVPTEANLLQLPSNVTSKMKVSFPSIKASGIYGKPPGSEAARVELVLTLDAIDAVFQPEVLDSLFAVFKQIERDLNQLEDLILKARRGRTALSSVPVPKVDESAPETQLLHSIRFALRGFKIGLKGPQSIQYVEASLLRGEISSPVGSDQEPLWSFSVDELGLSLAQTSIRNPGAPSAETAADRRYRSAYVAVNFQARNSPFGPSTKRTRQATLGKPELRGLHIRLDQVHGTLQASAILELSDLIDHYKIELERRKIQRAAEFEDIKSRAARVWQSTDEPREAEGEPSEPESSWWEDRAIQLQVQDVGFAFPLSREEIKSTVCPGEGQKSSVPALLISVRELSFQTKRTEKGTGAIKDVSLQFVTSFDQADPTSFDGLLHRSYNRLHFPLLSGEMRSLSCPELRQISVEAEVSEFQLALDSTLPNYVYPLIDVFEQGKTRLQRLAKETNLEQYYGQGTQVVVEHAPSLSKKKGLEVQTAFEFKAGHVSLFSYEEAEVLRAGPYGIPTPGRPRDAEVFVLPTVSIWSGYHDRAPTPSSSPLPDLDAPPGPALLINTSIHSTENSLSPDVLPFFEQISKTADKRSPKPVSPEITVSPLPSATETALVQHPPPPAPSQIDTASTIKRMQISISLQLYTSKLQVLTSREDLTEVTVAWKSGGFLFNIEPGFETFSMVGTVGGVTTTFINKNLHSSPEDEGLQASAQNLSLSVRYAPDESFETGHRKILSVTFDTEFSSSFDFVRFEDILCFKAVWLDRIPAPNSTVPVTEPRPARERTNSSSNALALTAPDSPPLGFAALTNVIVLVRVRKVSLKVQSKLSDLQLEIFDAVVRVRSSGSFDAVSFNVGEIKVEGTRGIYGHMTIPRLEFNVKHRPRSHITPDQVNLVSLRIKTGEIETTMRTEVASILKLSCGPIDLAIDDDWRGIVQAESERESLGLSFVVDLGTFNMAITVLTVPELLTIYGGYLEQIDEAVQSALRFSSSYARHHSLMAVPAHPLSGVASNLLASRRTLLLEDVEAIAFTIRQTMSFQAKCLVVVLYPQSFADRDLVRLDLGSVEAVVTRKLGQDLPTETGLLLKLGFFTLKRWNSSAPPPSLEDGTLTTDAWLQRAANGSSSRVILLPKTTIDMKTTVIDDRTIKEPTRTVEYDYKMSFEGAVDPSLNYVHLKWFWALTNTMLDKAKERLKEVESRRIKTTTPLDVAPPSPSSPASSRMTAAPTPTSPLLVSPAEDQPGASAEIKPLKVIYHARSEDIQQIQIAHLGEASQITSWMPKVANFLESAPKITHESATKPLIVLMEGLLETYKKQLPKKDSL